MERNINWIYIIAILLLLELRESIAINEFSQLKDYLSQCKEYDTIIGYKYERFFEIQDLRHTHDNETLLNLKVGVMATRDAHLLLSSREYPSLNESVYEIVIGAGGNSFSEIRKMKQKQPLKTRSLLDVLSPIKPTPINIKIFRNGTIQVWVIGKTTPLLTTYDRNLVDIHYLSFCSWGSAQGKWFYDCLDDDKVGDSLADIETRNMTSEEWLMKNLNEVDYTMPLSTENDNLLVETTFNLKQSHYVSKRSELISKGNFILKWQDPRLEWDPNEFDNTTNMRLFRTKFTWIPPLRIMNGKSTLNLTAFNLEYKMIFNSNGAIEAHSNDIEFITWCAEDTKIQSWPNDINTCTIQIASDNLKICLVDNRLFDTFPSPDLGWTEWKILKITTYDYRINCIDARRIIPVELEYKISFERNRNFFTHMFHTPLLVALLILLLSSWAPHPYRCGICVVSTIILTVIFLKITDYAPHSYTPTLMQYYVMGFKFALISLFFMLISSWFTGHPPEEPPSGVILNLLDNSYIRKFLLLGTITSFDYLHAKQRPWIELSYVFDRLLFIANLSIICIILCRGY